MKIQLIGDEIEVDGQIVGIIVPHAAPGPRFDFEDFLREAEVPDPETVENAEAEASHAALVAFEERLGKLRIFGGMVPMASVLDALKEVKQAA